MKKAAMIIFYKDVPNKMLPLKVRIILQTDLKLEKKVPKMTNVKKSNHLIDEKST